MTVTRRMESQRGRIGREIKSGLDRNGEPWANFSMAVDRNRLNEQGQWERTGTDWYQVSVFGAQARNVAQSLRSGAPIVVSGDLSQQVRVVEGPDGQPQAQTRDEVRADMVAPDLILTAVELPERPAASGPDASGPQAQESVERSAPSAAAAAPGPQSQPTSGGAAWPPVVEPGSGGQGATFR